MSHPACAAGLTREPSSATEATTRPRCASRAMKRARAQRPGPVPYSPQRQRWLERNSAWARHRFAIRLSVQPHRGQSGQGFRDVSTSFWDVCNVPKRLPIVERMVSLTRTQCGRSRDVSTAFRDGLPAFRNVPKRPKTHQTARCFPRQAEHCAEPSSALTMSTSRCHRAACCFDPYRGRSTFQR